MADDTYPVELYVDEVDVYDYDEGIFRELLELIEWENSQTEYDREIWDDDEVSYDDGEPNGEDLDSWLWGERE